MKDQNTSKTVNDNEILYGKKTTNFNHSSNQKFKTLQKDLFWNLGISLKKSSSDKVSHPLLKQLRTTNLENGLEPNSYNFF